MGYMLDFRDEKEKEDVIKKLYKANEALCDAIEALEGADGDKYNERNGGDYYNDGYYHRDGMSDERRMSMRRMRNGRGRFM